MGSCNLGLQTPALPVGCGLSPDPGETKGYCCAIGSAPACPSSPLLPRAPTFFWEWMCRSSSPAVGGSFHTVALTRSSSKDNVSPRKLTEVSFDSRLCNCLVWGRTWQVKEGRGWVDDLDTQDSQEQRGEGAEDKRHRQLVMRIQGSGSKGQCFGIQLMPMSHLRLSKPLSGTQRARLQDGVSCREEAGQLHWYLSLLTTQQEPMREVQAQRGFPSSP